MLVESYQKGRLFIISGPSGTGKGTVCRELLKELDIELSISMTTRQPRDDEQEAVSYYFVDEAKFKQKIEEDDLLEYAEVYGNYYGTPKQIVLDKLEEGKNVLLEIDIQGAMKVKKVYPEGVFIFLLPPSMSELRKRITTRASDTLESINIRMSKALKEVHYIDKYDYCVINDDLAEAVRRIKAIILAEHSRVSNNIYDLIKTYEEEI